MKKEIHSFLYLIWRDPRDRRNYIVGKLAKSDKYTFEYCEEYKDAKRVGWELLKAFPEDRLYESESLFAAFSGRLPDPKRKDIEEILKKYGLTEYDGFELLRKSTGRLPFDTYEFIDPIFPEDQTVERDFFVMGTRHYSFCGGENCEQGPKVECGEELKLVPEPDNESDSYAVKICTFANKMLGYIPRYYSKGVSDRLRNGITYSCRVIEQSRGTGCENCIKVRLRIPQILNANDM